MPTYEYRCKDCGHDLEAVQGFHDDPLTECPSCGGTLRKKFGSVGIAFKGSGFYKNDSRPSDSKTKPAEPATTSASGDGGSSSTSSGNGEKTSSTTETSKPAASGSGDSGSKTKTPAAS